MSSLTHILYLASSVLFILALKGLSSPKTARTGNFYGMTGMFVAIGATLMLAKVDSYFYVLIAMLIGGVIGVFFALKIKMTQMPQMVAGFHSLVGMAAVLIAFAALYSPHAFNITNADGGIYVSSLVEMGLGVIIGAITFSGSVIAFLKLNGNMKGAPIVFPKHHLINALTAIVILALLAAFCFDQSKELFIAMAILSFVIGFMLIIPIGGADMPVVVSMLNSYSG